MDHVECFSAFCQWCEVLRWIFVQVQLFFLHLKHWYRGLEDKSSAVTAICSGWFLYHHLFAEAVVTVASSASLRRRFCSLNPLSHIRHVRALRLVVPESRLSSIRFDLGLIYHSEPQHGLASRVHLSTRLQLTQTSLHQLVQSLISLNSWDLEVWLYLHASDLCRLRSRLSQLSWLFLNPHRRLLTEEVHRAWLI